MLDGDVIIYYMSVCASLDECKGNLLRLMEDVVVPPV